MRTWKRFLLAIAGTGAAVLLSACGGEQPSAATDGDGSLSSANVTGSPLTTTNQAPPAEVDRMKEFLRQNQPTPSSVRLTLKDVTGRLVDCVDREQQPTIKRLGEPLRLRPDGTPGFRGSPTRGSASLPPSRFRSLFDLATPLPGDGKRSVSLDNMAQVCPEGSVPIPRYQIADLARFKKLDEFLQKGPPGAAAKGTLPGPSIQPPLHQGPTSTHQYAHAYKYVDNWGIYSIMDVWDVSTQLNSEFSLTQTWLARGSGTGLQTVESGYQVYHDLYGDNHAHFFIYSTRDGYGTNGCYNGTCSDFVQVSTWAYPTQVIGASVSGGAQVEDYLFWEKYGDSDDWWIGIYYEEVGGTTEWIGYYPRSLYNTAGLANYSSLVDYGGEIINSETSGLHTQTDMGSGAFPSAGYGYASYQAKLQHLSRATNYWTNTTGATTSVSDSACYAINYNDSSPNDPVWGAYFYFGGPGYDATNCY